MLGDGSSQIEIINKYIERAKKREINLFICTAVLFESEFVLRKQYKISRKEIVNALGKIIVAPYLEIEDMQIFQETLLVYSKSSLDIVDRFLFCKAEANEAEILSFDEDLGKIKKKS